MNSDAAILSAILALFLAAAGVVMFVLSRSSGGAEEQADDGDAAAAPQAGIRQRPQQQQRRDRLGAGVVRRRAAAAAAAAAAADSDDGFSSDDDGGDQNDNRFLARARDARRNAAAVQRAAHEARQEKKESYEERRRQREAAREAAEEAREAELLREAEEKQKAIDEEAARWASLIEKEGEGEDGTGGNDGDPTNEDEGSLLERFVSFIERRKTVTLEELGAEFGLRASDAVDRIRKLEESERLTGIVDDRRGAYIFVSREELRAVAGFLRDKGRVAISELATESGRLIDLEPTRKEGDEEGVGGTGRGERGSGGRSVLDLDALAGDD